MKIHRDESKENLLSFHRKWVFVVIAGIFLLGGLLLLLLFLATVITSVFGCCCSILTLGFSLLFRNRLFFATSGNKKSAYNLSVQETVIVDLEFTENVVNFGGGEFVSPLGEGPSELLGADLALLLLVGLEGGNDEVIGVVGTWKKLGHSWIKWSFKMC